MGAMVGINGSFVNQMSKAYLAGYPFVFLHRRRCVMRPENILSGGTWLTKVQGYSQKAKGGTVTLDQTQTENMECTQSS